MSTATQASAQSSRQREDIDRIIADRAFQEAAARGHDCNILFAALALIGNGCRVRGGRQLERPELLARLCTEGAETCVIRRADEHQAPGGRDGATHIRPPGMREILGELIADAESALPGKLSRCDIDGGQSAPGRSLTHEAVVTIGEST